MSSENSGANVENAGMGASAGVGIAAAPATGGASLILPAMSIGSSLLGGLMGGGGGDNGQSAAAQNQLNQQQMGMQQNALSQLNQASPFTSYLMQLGNQSQQIPAAGALSLMNNTAK